MATNVVNVFFLILAANARESEKLGQAFKLLSEAFSLDDREGNLNLARILLFNRVNLLN